MCGCGSNWVVLRIWVVLRHHHFDIGRLLTDLLGAPVKRGK